MQHTATHCNTLQHTATHCNTLQHTATHDDTATHGISWIFRQAYEPFLCNTLQHTATHWDTLQHTATHCNTLRPMMTFNTWYLMNLPGSLWVIPLQHTATNCNTLQHTATHCNTLQHTATLVATPLITENTFWISINIVSRRICHTDEFSSWLVEFTCHFI